MMIPFRLLPVLVLSAALSATFPAQVQAQAQAPAQAQLPIPRNVREAIDKGTRTTTGKPGAHYWQNKADYTIRVTFDPQTRLVSGHETIVYSNNSPDTLKQ